MEECRYKEGNDKRSDLNRRKRISTSEKGRMKKPSLCVRSGGSFSDSTGGTAAHGETIKCNLQLIVPLIQANNNSAK